MPGGVLDGPDLRAWGILQLDSVEPAKSRDSTNKMSRATQALHHKARPEDMRISIMDRPEELPQGLAPAFTPRCALPKDGLLSTKGHGSYLQRTSGITPMSQLIHRNQSRHKPVHKSQPAGPHCTAVLRLLALQMPSIL